MSREAIGQLPHSKASGVVKLAALNMCFILVFHLAKDMVIAKSLYKNS